MAIVLELSGVPSLPFAVGVYLPLSASMPIFCGGAVRWLADRLSRRNAGESEMSPGVLLSSGYIAGGAIAGIVVASIMAKWKGLAVGPTWIGIDLASNAWVTVGTFSVLAILLLVVGARRNGENAVKE
jgi:hypothetical protein